jgi:RNA polymerase sigma factor (sigma-70 family)
MAAESIQRMQVLLSTAWSWPSNDESTPGRRCATPGLATDRRRWLGQRRAVRAVVPVAYPLKCRDVENRTKRAGMDQTWLLLQRARAGDQDAVEHLFTRYLPRLERWARGRLPTWARDITDTHDVVQDTLLQTFKKIDSFEYRGEGAFQAYLRQVLLNRIREQIRRTSRRPVSTEIPEGHEDPAPSPLERAIGQRAFDDYERALSRLRPEESEAIVGRVELGLSYDELALLQQKPSADAARKAVQRALVRLIDEMDGD